MRDELRRNKDEIDSDGNQVEPRRNKHAAAVDEDTATEDMSPGSPTQMYHSSSSDEHAQRKKFKNKKARQRDNKRKRQESSSDSRGSDSDDEKEKPKVMCTDCGEEVTSVQKIYKGCKRCHRHCGMQREKISRKLADNKEMLKVLMDARKKDPKTYQALVKEVAGVKGQHMSGTSLQVIQNAAGEMIRTKQLRGKEEMLFFDEGEFVHHWMQRKGYTREHGKKKYKKDAKHPSAVWRLEGDVNKLGVMQPYSLAAEDLVAKQVTKNAKGLSGADLKQMTAGFGEGLQAELLDTKGRGASR
jgi:hypothetical protein